MDTAKLPQIHGLCILPNEGVYINPAQVVSMQIIFGEDLKKQKFLDKMFGEGLDAKKYAYIRFDTNKTSIRPSTFVDGSTTVPSTRDIAFETQKDFDTFIEVYNLAAQQQSGVAGQRDRGDGSWAGRG